DAQPRVVHLREIPVAVCCFAARDPFWASPQGAASVVAVSVLLIGGGHESNPCGKMTYQLYAASLVVIAAAHYNFASRAESSCNSPTMCTRLAGPLTRTGSLRRPVM